MPGFVNAHTHAIHNLLRGGLSDDRVLYDWLVNVLYPGVLAYSAEDARIAARLFCVEAIRSGITTIVDNADFGRMDHRPNNDRRLQGDGDPGDLRPDVLGLQAPSELIPYLEAIEAKEPERPPRSIPNEETAAALDSTRG